MTSTPGGSAESRVRPPDLAQYRNNPDPQRVNECGRADRHEDHDPHDRGASAGWCPGYRLNAREAALASFLAADERLSQLRGHSAASLYQAAFDVLHGRNTAYPQAADSIEGAVNFWIKPDFRAAYIERLRRHVRSALNVK